MSFQLTPKQALVIWRLLITKEEPAKSKITPELSPAERNSLVNAGLITLEKRGRSEHIILTDKAWEWASEHYDITFSKSSAAVTVLEELLKIVGTYLKVHNRALSELFSSDISSNSVHSGDEIVPRVRNAYLKLSGGEFNRRVRLSQLRQFIEGVPRSDVDQALLQLGQDGKLTLMRLDDPLDIRPEDEQAALTSGGQQNHIIYMKEW